jgi:hypothetical protein
VRYECGRRVVMMGIVAVIAVIGALACSGSESPEADALRFFNELRRGDLEAVQAHSSDSLENLQECSDWLQRYEIASVHASREYSVEPSAAERLEGLGTLYVVDVGFAARERDTSETKWGD